jgi:hypothetical protein
MKSIAYADGIHNITLVDGVVRFELLELTPQPNGAEPTASSIGAVAMSIPAVLRTHQQLTGLIQKLVEQGVLKKEEAPVQPALASS